MLPVDRIRRRVSEAFQLAESFGQHSGVIFLVDDPIVPTVLFEQRRRKFVVPESAATFPVHGLADAALVRAVNDLLHTRDDVRVAVFAKLDHNPPSAHFMGDCARGAGTSEGVKDKIAGIGSDLKNALNKAFWLWCVKWAMSSK